MRKTTAQQPPTSPGFKSARAPNKEILIALRKVAAPKFKPLPINYLIFKRGEGGGRAKMAGGLILSRKSCSHNQGVGICCQVCTRQEISAAPPEILTCFSNNRQYFWMGPSTISSSILLIAKLIWVKLLGFSRSLIKLSCSSQDADWSYCELSLKEKKQFRKQFL